MKKETFSKISYWSKVIVIGVVLGTGMQFAQAWQEPTATPPNGNVPGPLTTGTGIQIKEGGLTLKNHLTVLANIGSLNVVTGTMDANVSNANKYCLPGTGGVKDCITSWPTGKLIQVKKMYKGDPANNDKDGALFCPTGYEAILCQNYRETPIVSIYPFGGIKFAFKATFTNDYPGTFSPGGCVASYCGADNSYECSAVALCQKK